ncbi:MAG: chemotaxis protein CheW [Planctomycetota bacterium]
MMQPLVENELTRNGSYRKGSTHCVFRVEDDWYSVPAQTVREIVVAPVLTEIPFCHSALLGLCHLRNEFLPVFSLNLLMDVGSESHWVGTERLLVLESQSSWALLISETAALNTIQLSMADEERPDGCLMGTALLNDKFINVLHVQRLYGRVQSLLEQHWSGHPLEQFA